MEPRQVASGCGCTEREYFFEGTATSFHGSEPGFWARRRVRDWRLNEAKDTITLAMQLLARADALIIDLRHYVIGQQRHQVVRQVLSGLDRDLGAADTAGSAG